ncbi:MAG: hypothetical protein E7311_04700 [Clostridiales bacterium]|nr:hypothetical protein [Clostridiales bacterium]
MCRYLNKIGNHISAVSFSIFIIHIYILFVKQFSIFFPYIVIYIVIQGGFMKFNTNREKGNTSLGIAIAYYSSNGYTVSIPLNDTQDYDLIIDKNNVLKKVQVKSTSCKTKYGNYQVALKSCGGTKGKQYKTVIDTNVDELFILTENIDIYILPINEIRNKSTLTICNKYEKYNIKK